MARLAQLLKIYHDNTHCAGEGEQEVAKYSNKPVAFRYNNVLI
jgi:hypothetical protein